MSNTQTIKNRINKELAALPTYSPEIPLGKIFEIVEKHAGQVVDVDGTPWSGILCGDNAGANFEIAGVKFQLRITWYKMQSGRYEITAYVS